MISEQKHSDKIIELAKGLNLVKGRGNVVNSAVSKYFAETPLPQKLNQITSYILKSIYSTDNISTGAKNG